MKKVSFYRERVRVKLIGVLPKNNGFGHGLYGDLVGYHPPYTTRHLSIDKHIIPLLDTWYGRGPLTFCVPTPPPPVDEFRPKTKVFLLYAFFSFSTFCV